MLSLLIDTVFNSALPAAEADLLAADVTPMFDPGYLDIFATFSIAGVLRVARTAGGVTVVEDLNQGNALVANSQYAFSIVWSAGESVNLRYSTTAGTILSLKILEHGS